MPKIQIVGESSKFDLDDVKDSVIYLGKKYYWKHDEVHLVRISIGNKKYKLYRKESPLVIETIDGYALLSNTIKTRDGFYVPKDSHFLVKLENGEYSTKHWAVQVRGKWYAVTDPLLVQTVDGGHTLKELAIKLDENYYGKDAYCDEAFSTVVKIDKSFFRLGDTRLAVRWNSTTNSREEYRIPPRGSDTSGSKYSNSVFNGFRDESNPDLGRLAPLALAKSESLVPCPGLGGLLVLAEELPILEEQIASITEVQRTRDTEKVREKLNKSFGDYDVTENSAKVIDKNYQTWPGKHQLFGNMGEPILSVGLKSSGGIGYTFGVEIETSAGLLPRKTVDHYGILAVGDRSIGSAEYVTPPLHGDAGFSYLKEVMGHLKEATLVDDRCSIHVHVGSSPGTTLNDHKIQFNRMFAVAMIKLGCLVEESLYKILPTSRNPYNKYCHSIQRYSDISLENWKEYLGTFVFGPHENFDKAIDMKSYEYGKENRNKETHAGNWCEARYKWLNLVRAYTSCSSPTVEFRIWSPTTNYDKVRCYVLLSLAMAEMANNHAQEIINSTEPITIRDVVNTVYSKNKQSKIRAELNDFITKRELAFNRKIVYTKTTPDKIKK